ncbi:TPA: hypothetical protein ACODKU_004301, partial [Salmonella enterica subsp. salamae serovar 21:z10:z6]
AGDNLWLGKSCNCCEYGMNINDARTASFDDYPEIRIAQPHRVQSIALPFLQAQILMAGRFDAVYPA